MITPMICLAVEIDESRAGSLPKLAASELHDDLTRTLPGAIASPGGPSDCDKGGPMTDLTNIGVALVNAGAFTQLLNCLKSFFSRDARRSVTLKDQRGVVMTNGRGEVLRIDATNVSDEVVIQAIKAAAGLPAG
ncbi:MAG: hypothetical protein QOE58_1256 [Actinomycetota bacterium]|jgi:hypothetical protein|nr:hypothetical protein [Actinomycetota bacterium]